MGETGQCWGINAVAKSAFSSLKNEVYHHYSFDTRQAARQATMCRQAARPVTMGYIKAFYNRWRPPPTTVASRRQQQ